MSELPVQKVQADVVGNGSIAFYNDHIIASSEEGKLKYFNPATLKIVRDIPIPKNITAIASNNTDTIVLGDQEGKVHTVFREKMDKQVLIDNTNCPITKIPPH
jgi:hypothetical protein